jgi:hypothetical protein
VLTSIAGVGATFMTAACGLPGSTASSPQVQLTTIRYLHVVSTPIWQENWGKIFSTLRACTLG